MEVVTAAEQLFFVTAFVRGKDANGDEWLGTGFAYFASTNRGIAHFLITNRHVVEDATELKIRMIAARDAKPDYGRATETTVVGVSDAFWAGHPDPRVDVAALPLEPIISQMNEEGRGPFFKSVSPDLLLRPDTSGTLDALEEVVFIGYPSGLFDATNLTPVARRGMTATPVGMDYEGEPAFLIDAAVFQGSSGSPVFVLARGGYAAREGGFVVGDRLICVGVLASGPARANVAEIIEVPQTTKSVAILTELLALGKVYKAWTIDDCVDVLLSRHGLSRIAWQPPEADEMPTSEADRTMAGPES